MKNFYSYFTKTFSLVLFLIVSSSGVFAQCPTVIWEDNFDGNSLDETKWNYQNGDGCAEGICGWGNGELQTYKSENIVVSNGTLKITAKKERNRGSQYSSGRINSRNKGDFTYGRFEASIKLPQGEGLWPAFWMLPTDELYGSWPQSGEIDIMEFITSQPDEVLGYIHYGDLYPGNQSQGNTYKLKNDLFTNDFHEFAIEWEPGEIRWYVDGILFSTKTPEDLAPYNWPFDKNFHLLLNLAVGGNLGGDVNDNSLPATMEVDYVRVYDGFKQTLFGDAVVSNQESGVVYSLSNLPSNTNVTWTVPAGATITSGQGTSQITVDYGSDSGDITATYNPGCGSITLNLPIEVEAPYVKEFSFENFDDQPLANFSSTTGTLTETSNPSLDAVNGTALVGEYIRNSQEQYDLVVYNTDAITDASAFVNKTNKFYMDVYTNAPVGTEIFIQLETASATAINWPEGRHSRYVASVTDTNKWQRLEFELLDRPDPAASDTDVNTLILLFASNTFTGDAYYFDNLDSYKADTGTSQNIAPSVNITSPTNGASFSAGTSISVTANATDADGTITQVEFFANGTSLGVDATAPYSIDYTVPQGATNLTATATDDDGATSTSASLNITGEITGSATSVHVASIVTGTVGVGKGQMAGLATITIIDDLGNPVADASVSGTFSGSFSEQGTAVTDANGIAVITTQAAAKGTLVVDFCVDNVVVLELSYEETANTITCTGAAKSSEIRFKELTTLQEEDLEFAIYPNPASEILEVRSPMQELIYQVYDLNGRMMIQGKDFKDPVINISQLRTGWYIVKLIDSEGRQEVKKIYKK